MKIPRIVLAGTQSGVGKTTISMGIMAALKKRGLDIQPFKVGPDYIDPAFHSFITQNSARNLDSWMLDEKTVLELFVAASKEKDMAVVEGVMGLYDGSEGDKHRGSTADVAKIIDAPVVLIVNGKGMAASAAAQVLGYKLFDTSLNIKAVIINNISGDVHYHLLKRIIERETQIPCIGYMPFNSEIQLKSRHLGLIPAKEVDDLKAKIEELAHMVERTIDLEALIEIANQSSELEYKAFEIKRVVQDINIGVAWDKAFSFYYEDNLELLRKLGANLIFFSPINDTKLPDNIHGIYLGGGFPEVFAKELESNIFMREDMKRRLEGNIPAYAECGGFMYLTKAINTIEGQRYEMVGIFDTEARMTHRLQRFGYIYVNIHEECSISKNNTEVRAHEFHRSVIDEHHHMHYVYTVNKKRDHEIIKTWSCGLKKYHTLGSYAHIHFYSNKKLAEDFLLNCRAYRREKVDER